METSRPYKYQCLTVKECQLRPLTAILKKLPADWRCIRYLFLSEESWEFGDGSEQSEFFHTDKNRLLTLAAPTLEILEVGCQYYRYAAPFQLPVLTELVLHGYPDMIQPSRNIVACYPALRSLCFWDTSPVFITKIAVLLHETAPALTKIRFPISYSHLLVTVLTELKTTTQIQKILLQVESGHIHHEYHYRGIISRNSQLRDAVVILKSPTSTYEQPMVARKRWSEVCAGRLDYWEPTESESYSEAATNFS
jgi:hypothetical protein